MAEAETEAHLYWEAIRRHEEAEPPRAEPEPQPEPEPAQQPAPEERPPATDKGERHRNRRRLPPRTGPVPKTREYYRRTGALWTDLYHTPPNRLHLVNHRPDLDAAHDAEVRRRAAAEAERARKALRRRANVRKNERNRLAHQRYRNLRRHAAGTVRMESPPPKPARELSARGRPQTAKDRFFFRRTGNLWSDYAHLPDQRRHLVVRPGMVENDERAFEHILDRMREDDERDAAQQEARLRKVRAVRDEFVRRREVNLKQEAVIFRNAPKRYVPKHGKPRRPQSAGERIDQLALPKARNHVLTDKPFQHSDFAGLLGSDLTIRSQLSELREHKPRAASCPLPYHTGTAGQRGRGVVTGSESLPGCGSDSGSSSGSESGGDSGFASPRRAPPEAASELEQIDWFEQQIQGEAGAKLLQSAHGSINYAAMLE